VTDCAHEGFDVDLHCKDGGFNDLPEAILRQWRLLGAVEWEPPCGLSPRADDVLRWWEGEELACYVERCDPLVPLASVILWQRGILSDARDCEVR
jgi:hypothetical protein